MQLLVDLRQIPLHRLRTHEELACDFDVRIAGGDQFRDALLGRGQGAGTGRSAADLAELGARLLRPQAGTEALENLKRALQRRSGCQFLAGTPLYAAEREQRPGMLERPRRLQPLVAFDRPFEVTDRRSAVASSTYWRARSRSPRGRATRAFDTRHKGSSDSRPV